MHYYKRNIGDYAKKAGRLSILQHGVYNLLIDACYDREKFPTREEALDWVWASTPEEEQAVDFVLRKFFSLENGVYVQNRIAEEIAEYEEFCRLQEEKGKKGGRPKKKPDGKDKKPDGFSGEASGKPTESQRGSEKTLTTTHYPPTTEPPRESAADAAPPPKSQGSRLPENWEPAQEYFEAARKIKPQLTDEQINLIAGVFRDYWIAKIGKDARKADWLATWRNWIRREKQFTGGANATNHSSRNQPGLDPDDTSWIESVFPEQEMGSGGSQHDLPPVEGDFSRVDNGDEDAGSGRGDSPPMAARIAGRRY